MKVQVLPVLLFLFSSLLISCSALTGEEIGRLAINEVSTNVHQVTKELKLDLKKDQEIAFWSEMDMEYEGQVALRFRVKIMEGEKEITSLEINPMDKNITIGEVKTSIMNKTKWRFTGKNAEITIRDDGNYTFISQLIASENPTLVVNKAELVLKN